MINVNELKHYDAGQVFQREYRETINAPVVDINHPPSLIQSFISSYWYSDNKRWLVFGKSSNDRLLFRVEENPQFRNIPPLVMTTLKVILAFTLIIPVIAYIQKYRDLKRRDNLWMPTGFYSCSNPFILKRPHLLSALECSSTQMVTHVLEDQADTRVVIDRLHQLSPDERKTFFISVSNNKISFNRLSSSALLEALDFNDWELLLDASKNWQFREFKLITLLIGISQGCRNKRMRSVFNQVIKRIFTAPDNKICAPVLGLPTDLWAKIFENLPFDAPLDSLYQASQACQQWNLAAKKAHPIFPHQFPLLQLLFTKGSHEFLSLWPEKMLKSLMIMDPPIAEALAKYHPCARTWLTAQRLRFKISPSDDCRAKRLATKMYHILNVWEKAFPVCSERRSEFESVLERLDSFSELMLVGPMFFNLIVEGGNPEDIKLLLNYLARKVIDDVHPGAHINVIETCLRSLISEIGLERRMAVWEIFSQLETELHDRWPVHLPEVIGFIFDYSKFMPTINQDLLANPDQAAKILDLLKQINKKANSII